MEEQKDILRILDYSMSPGPRYCNQGDDSGEDFYHAQLNSAFAKAYSSGKQLLIDLDGPDGYASSFLDEAFGNLIYDFSQELVSKIIILKSDEEPEWIEMLEQDTYIKWETRRINQSAPRITKVHEGWYRINNEILENDIWISFSGK